MNTEELFTPLTCLERAALLDEKAEMPSTSPLLQAWRQLIKKKSALLGLSLLLLLMIMAIIGPYLSP